MTRHREWPLGPLTPEDIPAGMYLAGYRTWERRSYYGQPKLRLDFVIIEPVAFAGIIVSFYATCKADQNKRPSRLGKYYALWVHVNGGPPQRGQRMTPSIFRGYWRVRVAWSYDKTGEPTTPYVAELIDRVAGGVAG